MSFWVHDLSLVDERAEIGDGTKIWEFCNVMAGAKIGSDCSVGGGCFIESKVVVGNRVKIKNNIALYNGFVCEDDVFLGPNCVFTNVINPRSFIEKKDEFRITKIRKGATIGANSTVICGHTIGCYALIGAGSVITHDIPDYALVIGNPARMKGYVCCCGERLRRRKKIYLCEKCNKVYRIKSGNLVLEE